MAKVDKSVAPYYDDYNSSKQYTQLLAVPGRVAQAREITQIQSAVKDIIKGIGDSMMKNGNIIEGCQVIVNDTLPKSATVTSGKVYINGMVLPVSETTISITGVGTETIGFVLMESIITESEDPTLRDPAQGYDNYNQPGCHRIKSWINVVRNDPDASILTTLIDGEIAVEKYAPDYDVLTQTLARRTYDESGSYLVDGLKVRVEANTSSIGNYNVVVESGKAYVLGYELKIPAPRRLTIPRSTTHGTVTARYNYDQSISTYQLSSAPYVESITSVRGHVSKTVNQTISSNTDRVLIDELEVLELTSVSQGAKTYTIGTASTGDCYLQRDGTRYYVKWNGTDNYPTLNTSYSVTYKYEKTFTQNTDYELYHDTATDSHNIRWITTGDKPLNGTPFTVIYEQYLARKDIVYIDQYGNIAVIQGTPAEYGFDTLPEAPVNTLALASIMNPPGGNISGTPNTKITVSNVGLTRFTMNDIQKMLSRIRTLEYDQTILSLNDEAKQYETTNDKRGIFTDPLVDLSKIDYYFNLSGGEPVDPDLPIYDATLDLAKNICYLPTESKTYDSIYDNANSTSTKYGRTVTLAKTGEYIVMSQLNATKSFLVNPYSKFPQLPEISITPAVDTWIDDTIIEVPVSKTMQEVISSSSRHIETTSTSTWGSNTTVSDTSIGTKVSTSSTESVISENTIKYIRRREIEVEGYQFPANLDNIKCYFDGVVAPLTATGSTEAGTETGSIKANASGGFTAKFTIPDNILTGIREVRLESSTAIAGYENSAFALYQASGTERTVQRTVTTLTTVLLNRVTTTTTTTYIDPVGQTFVLDSMTLVSGIDLYFESKPTGSTSVTCEIRAVINGTITSTVYGHKTLSASEVSVSSDSKVATRFSFDDPVLLEENKEYAFVVRSTSSEYRLWIADIGENDIITGEPVLSNPYLIGVMMSSSNNSSWTSHQTADIKFRLVADTYSNSSDVYFQSITGEDEFSRIYLLADTVIPNGTRVNWYYSVDAGSSYKAISPYNISLLDQMKQNIIIKATLSRDDSTLLSPIIAIDSVGAVLSSYDSLGYYISSNITGLDSYTTVDLILDTHSPSNDATIKVYVSTDGGNTLKEATLTHSKSMSYGWVEKSYQVTVSSATQCKIFIKLESAHAYFTPAFRRLRVIMS